MVWRHAIINVTSARPKCKFPDDGRRPKHVGADLICFNVNFGDLQGRYKVHLLVNV